MPKRVLLFIALGFGIITCQTRAQFVSSEKANVRPIQTTDRCKTLDRMLEKNGFAVTTRQFPQMFLAYIQYPGSRYRKLPPFITTDSAWHTYQVLLEAGVKRLEQRQAVRLKAFSRRLLARTTEAAGEGRSGFNKIANYASIALAIQDEAHAAKLPNEQKAFLAALKEGAGQVRGPVGFPISASAFRARSFYTSSAQLSDYFTARQWYAMVVFPVSDRDATSLAVRLAMLINSDDHLSSLWEALSKPYDSLLAKAEDGDVAVYASAVRKVVDKGATLAQAARSAEALQKHLDTLLPNPQVNDQLLTREQHANFPKVIKGFRVLPPRRLTWSVCFQKTTPPGAGFPSALHFMVACKQMRSAAAVRALQQTVGEKKAVRIQQVDPGKLPDSLHGRAMKLISTLQKPPPAEAPKAMKTTAWADKQLWTQLGAWAQQGHTWTLHAKPPSDSWGSPRGTGDVGMVSPYPEFFESLGTLTRQTAKALSQAGSVREKDARGVSEILLAHAKIFVSYRPRYEPELTEQVRKELEEARPAATRMRNFVEECISRHRTLFGPSKHLTEESVLKDLQELARRCIKTGKASENDLKILNAFAQPGALACDRIDTFASACDSLASIARKQLAGKPLDERENDFLRGYGLLLALCHLYEDASWKNVHDDFPIISPVFASPLAGRTLYAALGRPRELLVRGKLNARDTLMRGAVLSYREFTRPVSQPLDDESWQQIIRNRQSVPKPPDFTKSFIARPDEDEFVEMLGEGKLYLDVNNIPGRKVTRALIKLLSTAPDEHKSRLIKHLRARCTAEDVPVLIKLMRESPGSLFVTQEGCFYDMTDLVAGLPCKSGAAELMEMLTGDNTRHARAAAEILYRQPELIDSARLTSQYDEFPTSKRGLCCFVLGYVKKVDQSARDTMLKALSDRDACLRWQGAVTLGQSGAKHPKIIKALSERIDDSNVYVAGEALRTLIKLKASPDAKTLLDTLKRRFRARNEGSPIDFARSAIGAPWQNWMEYPESGGLFDPGYSTYDEEFTASWSYFPYESTVTLPLSLDEVILNRLIELKYKPAVPVILGITVRNGFTRDDLGFDALKKLDRGNYVEHLVKLALNQKASPWSRATALKRFFSYEPPATICRRLIPVLGDKTPVMSSRDTEPGTLGNLAVILIAKAVFPNETFRTPDVFDKDTGYTEEFKKLAEKVLKWSRTTTRSADK